MYSFGELEGDSIKPSSTSGGARMEAAVANNIFVSYAQRDRQLADEALEHLRRRRLIAPDDNVFTDHASFAAGDDFRDATRAAIADADKVFVIWSREAANSKWINYEVGMADALRKKLVIVVPKAYADTVPKNLQFAQIVEVPGG
jgi:hypothetical protein